MGLFKKKQNYPIHGVMAEFKTSDALLAAAKKTAAAGYTEVEAYSPFPIHHLAETLGTKKTIIPKLVLAAGIMGAFAGYGLQYFTSVIDYPINIGGRPLNSWPAFLPITFECSILFAALTAVFGMLGINGFPMPYHPVFNVPEFVRASQDRFFISIRAWDPQFNTEEVKSFLQTLDPLSVVEVEP